MKSLIKGLTLNYSVKVFATGFIVLVLLSLPLFWVRSACETFLAIRMPGDAGRVRIGGEYVRIAKDVRLKGSGSGLMPDELENDPNVVSHSKVYAGIDSELPLSLGIVDYFIARFPEGRRSNVYFFASNNTWMYFDKEFSQIVYYYIEKQKRPDGTTSRKDVELYIGPEGVSEAQDKTLGRFIDPIIDRWIGRRSREIMLYDKKLQCFFKSNNFFSEIKS